MRLWIISDTHQRHGFLDIPDDVDMVIHAGDGSNQKDPYENEQELLNFLMWYESLKHIKHKIFVPGNHETSMEEGFVTKEMVEKRGIHCLMHESIIIDNMKFFGSPYTKFFNYWAYNVMPDELEKYWKDIPLDTDVLITHGPPKGVLDLVQYHSAFLQVGCPHLFDVVCKVKPKYHIFGHVHQEEQCNNAGIIKLPNIHTTFINAATVTHGKKLHNNGFIIDL